MLKDKFLGLVKNNLPNLSLDDAVEVTYKAWELEDHIPHAHDDREYPKEYYRVGDIFLRVVDQGEEFGKMNIFRKGGAIVTVLYENSSKRTDTVFLCTGGDLNLAYGNDSLTIHSGSRTIKYAGGILSSLDVDIGSYATVGTKFSLMPYLKENDGWMVGNILGEIIRLPAKISQIDFGSLTSARILYSAVVESDYAINSLFKDARFPMTQTAYNQYRAKK